MSLPPLIPVERIISDSRSGGKRPILSELIALLPELDASQVLDVVMVREHLGSTGIGHGVAIPHGRIPELHAPLLALARHRRGIDFDAIDGKPVHIVILLLAPEGGGKAHLELLAHLARILQQAPIREAIMNAASASEIAELFPAPVGM